MASIDFVRSSFAHALGLSASAVDDHTDYLSQGGDSLSAIRLSIVLRGAGFPASARDILAGLTVAQIAASNPNSTPSSNGHALAATTTAPKAKASDPDLLAKIRGAADIPALELEYVLYKHSIPAHHIEGAFLGTHHQRGSLLLGFSSYSPRPHSIEFDVLVVDVDGDPTGAQVRAAVDVLLRKHTILRCIPAITQKVNVVNVLLKPEHCTPRVRVIDNTVGDEHAQERAFQAAMEDERHEGYRSGAIAWRLIYARATSARKAQLVWVGPHSHLDGWSFSVLSNDLASILNGIPVPGSDFRPYADWLAYKNSSRPRLAQTADDIRWFRQVLAPIPRPLWPVPHGDVARLPAKRAPVIDGVFYTYWKLNFSGLSARVGVSPFAACMSAVGCSLAVREGSLVTDRPVTMAYLSSGRTFDLEGITEMAGPALNLMVTKLNPRADKSARALLAESNARFRGDFGRDHTLQFHWDEIFDDPSSSSSSSSEKNHESGEGAGEGGGKALSLNDLAALQVSIAFQSLPVMGTGPSGGSNGSGSGYKYNVHRSWESMSTISPLGLEIFPAGGDPVQYAAQSLEKKSGGEETTWMVRTSYDSSVVSLEEATTFIDDSFVHLKRMLTRPEERLDGLVVTEPGVYTSTNGKDGKEERWDFVPANERKVHLFPLRPAAPLSAFFRLWMTFFTIMMFNLRLAFRGKPKEGGAKIKTN